MRLGLVRMLNPIFQSTNARVVLTGIECLETVLAKGKLVQEAEELNRNPFLYDLESENMLPQIEELQRHPNQRVYERIAKVIDDYLETADNPTN